MHASVNCLLYIVKMLVSVSIAAGFQLILSWAIMVVEECCSLVDLYNGIRNAVLKFHPPAATLSSFLKPSKSSHFRSCGKQSGPFQPCNLVAKLREVASFGTYL